MSGIFIVNEYKLPKISDGSDLKRRRIMKYDEVKHVMENTSRIFHGKSIIHTKRGSIYVEEAIGIVYSMMQEARDRYNGKL